MTGEGSGMEEGMKLIVQGFSGDSVRSLSHDGCHVPDGAVVLHHAVQNLDWQPNSRQLLLVYRERWLPLDMVMWKRRGASGWLDLLDPADEIRERVADALRGIVPVATARCRPFLHRMDDFSDSRLGCRLTGRELHVSQLLARGLSSKEAAEQLGISPHTVQMHRKALYRKLGVRSAVQFFQKIERLGVVAVTQTRALHPLPV
jgi:DNA-binding CsgD family transcriptional regulator